MQGKPFKLLLIILSVSSIAWSAAFAREPAQAQSAEILSLDHMVRSTSRAKSSLGQPIKLFVRERVRVINWANGEAEDRPNPVLFVHGGAFPGVPDFDLPYQDYSWMAYLAANGFDAYSLDLTGYGRSTRLNMDDPCSVVPAMRAIIGATSCPEGERPQATSLASDWADIDAVVEFIRKRTGTGKVNIVGWSGGGPRAGGYAALHPDKVERVFLLAPAYIPVRSDRVMAERSGGPTGIATREITMARWKESPDCEGQIAPGVRDAVWKVNMEMDPVGAGWGPGVVRFPTTRDHYVWPRKLARKLSAPVLMVVGDRDTDVNPAWVRGLYEDAGASSKVLVNVKCSTHFLVYEKGRHLLFKASRDWLRDGEFRGMENGVLNLDADGSPWEAGDETQESTAGDAP